MRVRIRVAAFAAFFAVLTMPAAGLVHAGGFAPGGSDGNTAFQA